MARMKIMIMAIHKPQTTNESDDQTWANTLPQSGMQG